MRIERKFLILVLILNLGLVWILVQTQMVQQFALQQSAYLPDSAQSLVESSMQAIQSMRDFNREYARFLLMLFLSSSLAVCGLVYIWFVRPIRRLQRSIDEGRLDEIRDLCGEKSELGALARLVVQFRQHQDALETEIMLRNNTEGVLRRRERQMSALIREREAISRDLHDGLIQSLYALGLQLESTGSEGQNADIVRALQKQINDAIRQVRGYINQSPTLDGEVGRLKEYSEELVSRMNHLGKSKFRLHWDEGVEDVLDLEQATQLQAILTEAVSNTLRHSGAETIRISVKQGQDGVDVTVEDDGVGFDKEQSSGGHGLANMASRAKELGASFDIESQPGNGCTLLLKIPACEAKEPSH